MISNPDNPEGFEEVHSKVIESIHDILKDKDNITKWYNLVKSRNTVVCEPNSTFHQISIFDTIKVVSEFELLRQIYPVEITKDEYSSNFVIMVDKVKYRKYIVAKLLK